MSVSFFGDYDTTETVVIPFNSFTSDDPSASVTLTNLASTDVYIYKDGSLTQRTSAAGIVVDVDVDGIAGNHWVTIDLSDNTDAGFYVSGSRYQARMEGVTIDAAQINAWIGAWSIGCTLRPTTAGNKLDVTATGAAGIDWGNVENPTTAVDLSATDIQLCDTVTTLTGHTVQTGDTYAELPSNFSDLSVTLTNGYVTANFSAAASSDVQAQCNTALVGQRLDHLLATSAIPGDIANDSVMAQIASKSATAAWTSYDNTTHSLEAIGDAAADPWSTAVPGAYGAGTAGNILGNMVDLVWDEDVDTSHQTAGSAGKKLDDAGAGGDPWSTTVPGAYGAGTAGNILGNVVDLVWDEDVDTSHQTAGTAGKKLDDAGGAADPWATAIPGAYGAGTAGKILGDNVDAQISTRMAETSISTTGGAVDNVTTVATTTTNTDMRGTDSASTHSAADVWTATTRDLTAATNITSDGSAITMFSSGVISTVNTTTNNTDMRGTDSAYTGTPPTVDQIWDEVQSGHSTPGSFGLYLDSAVSAAGGGGLTEAGIADAVWDETMGDHTGAGSTGQALNAAGGAGDPWISDITGTVYTSNQAGYMLENASELAWTHPHRSLTTTIPAAAGPQTGPNEFTLYKGDDYTIANGRNLSWTYPTPPDATGGSVTIDLQLVTSSTPELAAHAGSITNANTSAQAMSFEFAAGVTGALAAGVYRYVITLTLSGGGTVTVATGQCNVLEPI